MPRLLDPGLEPSRVERLGSSQESTSGPLVQARPRLRGDGNRTCLAPAGTSRARGLCGLRQTLQPRRLAEKDRGGNREVAALEQTLPFGSRIGVDAAAAWPLREMP